MAVIDETSNFGKRVRERLNDDRVVWLITQGRNGTPQPSPVWFLPDGDDEVLIYSQPDTPKVRNIATNPTVSLAFNTDFHGGDVVVFHGEARVDEASPPASGIPAYVAKYQDGLDSLKLTPEAFSATYSTPIRVRLTRLRG